MHYEFLGKIIQKKTNNFKNADFMRRFKYLLVNEDLLKKHYRNRNTQCLRMKGIT